MTQTQQILRRSLMARWAKWIGLTLAGTIIVATLSVVIATISLRLPGSETTPAGFQQKTSIYIKMRDGVEIAVTVLIPPDLKLGERVPVLMRTTRYWRGQQTGWGMRAMVALGLVDASTLVDEEGAYFNHRRFAVLLVDARGSGASGGRRPIEYAPAEISDMGEVAAWSTQQPWSNGQVGTFGVSYDGNEAELAAAAGQPAIRAVMPLYDDFDSQALVQPGGVTLRGVVGQWARLVAALDRNDVCGADDAKGWQCWKDRQLSYGAERVDADQNGAHLTQLVRHRDNISIAKVLGSVEFRDDLLTTDLGSIRFADISPYGLKKKIEASQVPMMVWCGWLDANSCEGALDRYRTLSNPQVLVIGPLSHGGDYNVDPFAANHLPPVPTRQEQLKMEADFFQQVLGGTSPADVPSSIRYYTMGEGAWHTTTVWPPDGISNETLFLSEGSTLAATAPTKPGGADTYKVDLTATSGDRTRWHTQLGGGDVVYGDRAMADEKLLKYTSLPLDSDLEITGSPVLTLQLASSTSDGAVHAYLEDVAPTGYVTYIDEGVFRIINRKETDPTSLPYAAQGPAHSFRKEDAEPLQPGVPASIRFSLLPTSLLLRRGHSIRLALAGADSGLFQTYPASGTPEWTLFRNAERSSFLVLPVKRYH